MDEFNTLSQSLMDAGHAEYMADLQSAGKLIYRSFSFNAVAKTVEVVSLWASQGDYDAHTVIKSPMWQRMEDAGIATLTKVQEEL